MHVSQEAIYKSQLHILQFTELAKTILIDARTELFTKVIWKPNQNIHWNADCKCVSELTQSHICFPVLLSSQLIAGIACEFIQWNGLIKIIFISYQIG